MQIIRKTRGSCGTEVTRQIQKLFFCCAKEDFGERNAVIDDLLSHDAGMDCVVSYLETADEPIDFPLLKDEIQESGAVVLWVTTELLKCFASGNPPSEYLAAKQASTPILPIANDDGLLVAFTSIIGAVHGIQRHDGEYRTKLRQMLESLLVSDEMMDEINQHAFTARVFLSYRKKDIDQARRLMRSVHDLDGLESLSIWYDQFLTAGGDFNEEIKEYIANSDAFVLVVTPNLNEDGNYVVTIEYPYAKNDFLQQHSRGVRRTRRLRQGIRMVP